MLINMAIDELDYMQEKDKQLSNSTLFELIMRKSKNKNEYKKYAELAGMLMLSYNKRLSSMSEAEKAVYDLINESNSVNDLVMHYNALMEEEKANADKSTENAKARIANMLLMITSAGLERERRKHTMFLCFKAGLTR